MDEKKTTKGRGFSSPLMMAISLIAASVGTGNIWRFPRVLATHGGSAFVVAYVVIMLIAVIPVMMGEHVIGRCTRKGLPGAFRDFLGSRKATWLGTFVEWVVIITIAYYTVVVAWIFQYLGKSITGSCFVEDKAGLFASVSDHNWVSVLISTSPFKSFAAGAPTRASRPLSSPRRSSSRSCSRASSSSPSAPSRCPAQQPA